jgi:hypothetical protein
MPLTGTAAYFVEQRKGGVALDSRVCVSLAQAKESNSLKGEKDYDLNEINFLHSHLTY